MSDPNINPVIPAPLRVTFVFVVLVLLIGPGLFFLPDWLATRWPWSLKPFNTRFLGAIYLAEMVMMIWTVVVPRWTPGRLTVVLAFTFTAVVTLASLLSIPQFVRGPMTTTAWYVVYVLPLAVTAYYTWRERARVFAFAPDASTVWQGFLLLHGVVLGVYGIGLFFMPAVFSAFWPWRLDPFHAQVYSAVFITMAVASFVLRRAAASVELMSFGATELTFGVFAVMGLLVVDLSVNKVDWAAAGTWFWLAGLLAMALSGTAMIARARRQVRLGGFC